MQYFGRDDHVHSVHTGRGFRRADIGRNTAKSTVAPEWRPAAEPEAERHQGLRHLFEAHIVEPDLGETVPQLLVIGYIGYMRDDLEIAHAGEWRSAASAQGCRPKYQRMLTASGELKLVQFGAKPPVA